MESTITKDMKVRIPTELSFYGDTSKLSMDAFIDDICIHEKFGPYVILSKTLFYPQGGGQKGDIGHIEIDSDIASKCNLPTTIKVTGTKKDAGFVLHLIDTDYDQQKCDEHLVGNKISMSIDWDFRLKQMRLHSIAHLIHFFTEKVHGKELPYPISSDLQDGFGINRYAKPDLVPNESSEEIKKMLFDFNNEEHEITTFPHKEKDGFRYWQCSDYVVPCGGAHLTNTSQIDDFSVIVSTKKGKTSVRFNLA